MTAFKCALACFVAFFVLAIFAPLDSETVNEEVPVKHEEPAATTSNNDVAVSGTSEGPTNPATTDAPKDPPFTETREKQGHQRSNLWWLIVIPLLAIAGLIYSKQIDRDKQQEKERRRLARASELEKRAIDTAVENFVCVSSNEHIRGHKIARKFGWVRCRAERKSTGQELLIRRAAEMGANALINFSSSLHDETVTETSPSGKTYHRRVKRKEWEAEAVRVVRISNSAKNKKAQELNPVQKVEVNPRQPEAHVQKQNQHEVSQRPAQGTVAVIDGSNIMFMGDNKPNLSKIADVAADMREEGYQPHIFFDANFRYKLERPEIERSAIADEVGVEEDRITVVPGNTSADEYILQFARKVGGFVVSEDRFRQHGNRREGVQLVVPMLVAGERCYNL